MNIKKFFSSASVCRQGGFFSLTFLGIVFILISCDIAKTNGLAGLSLSPSNLTIPIGEEREITAHFSPANAIASITWSNSHTNIIELTDMSGNKVTVKAIGVGISVITAEADGITNSITVIVVPGMPKNITVATTNGNEWNLSWNSSAGAKVYRISVSNDGFEIINHTNSGNDKTSLTTNNLNFLTRYTATIQACQDDNLSTCSSGSTNFVLGDNGTNLAAVIAAGKIPANLSDYDDQTRAVFGDYAPNTPVIFRYVATNGSGNNTGSSWSNVATSLKTVLEGITDTLGSEVYAVLIGPGTYRAGATMAMKNHVTIVGGVPQNTSDGGETILSGENHYRVFNNTGLNNTARLYGVTIANGNTDNKGGGMNNSSSSPTLTKVVFSGNTAGIGGGMANYSSSSPTLSGVVFSSNTAGNNGGGMYNENSQLLLNEVVFSGNRANISGGGMYNDSSSPILTGVVFSDNTANISGGGMYNWMSSPTLTGVVFSSNKVTGNTGSGGGMANDNQGRKGPIIVNSIFWGNRVISKTNQIYFNNDRAGQENLSLYNSIVEGGMPSGYISGTSTDGFNGGVFSSGGVRPDIVVYFSNIISADPKLSSLTDNGGGIPTMAITNGSSAKDKGIFVKRSAAATGRDAANNPTYTFYYSIDNSTWYTTPALTGATVNLPNDAIDLTATDMTGYPVTGRPDIGVYEAR